MNKDMIDKLGDITDKLLEITNDLEDLLVDELDAINETNSTAEDLTESSEYIKQAIRLCWDVRWQLELAVM